MKSLWLFSVIFSVQSIAAAMCAEVKDYEGTYQILEVSDAHMKCEAKPKGKLHLPGCQIRLMDEESKVELTVYADLEICSLQKGTKSQMEISGSCCDVEESHPCKFYSDGEFKLIRSYEQYSCLGAIGKYVSSYSSKKNGKDVFRRYSLVKKMFVDAAPAVSAKTRK